MSTAELIVTIGLGPAAVVVLAIAAIVRERREWHESCNSDGQEQDHTSTEAR